jgi:hypothetical protein
VRPEEPQSPALSFVRLVVISSLPGFVLFGVAWWPGEPGLLGNVASEALGLSVSVLLISLLLERRQAEAERLRLQPVERQVLESLFTLCSELTNFVSWYVDVRPLGEDRRLGAYERVRQFRERAEIVRRDGLHLPSFNQGQVAATIDVFGSVLASSAMYQQAYPFVFQAHPRLATYLADFIAFGQRFLLCQRARLNGSADDATMRRRAEYFLLWWFIASAEIADWLVDHLKYIRSEMYAAADEQAE